ncbi:MULTISPECIES: WG repeat-containing protein [unclassified Carboxylicivirga]|uniref:WG repeat-containing protein n=1 Tax=Carboxylicivirga TaxID=1628153 RepID=UPI003D342897
MTTERNKMKCLKFIIVSFLAIISCKQHSDSEHSNCQYFDKTSVDTSAADMLIAITDEDYLQYGARIAFVNADKDTIIPYGKYTYLGSDTLKHYANVMVYKNDSLHGRFVAIDRNENILYDIVFFDNGPDYFHEGLVRVLRNGKMGFANKYGQVVIPCEYDFARRFKNGKAEVTYRATQFLDSEEHKQVLSDEWFQIDKSGNKI